MGTIVNHFYSIICRQKKSKKKINFTVFENRQKQRGGEKNNYTIFFSRKRTFEKETWDSLYSARRIHLKERENLKKNAAEHFRLWPEGARSRCDSGAGEKGPDYLRGRRRRGGRQNEPDRVLL